MVKRLPISTKLAAVTADVKKLQDLTVIDIPSIDTNDVMLLIGTDSPDAYTIGSPYTPGLGDTRTYSYCICTI